MECLQQIRCQLRFGFQTLTISSLEIMLQGQLIVVFGMLYHSIQEDSQLLKLFVLGEQGWEALERMWLILHGDMALGFTPNIFQEDSHALLMILK